MVLRRRSRTGPPDGTLPERLAATELWFAAAGLPWFVPERRDRVRAVLRSRATYIGLVAVAVAAAAVGVGLARLTGDPAVAPAALVSVTAVAVVLYVGERLEGWPIARWAVGSTMGSLRLLLPLVTRALPLLLLFVTFLFINAEVWQLAATLDGGVLWIVVLLFAVFALTFLWVRIPEEIDEFDRSVSTDRIAEACTGTPLETDARDLVDDPDVAPEDETELRSSERTNLLLVLVIAQAVQVALLSVSVFAFFLLFGGLVMRPDVQAAWTGGQVQSLPVLSSLSVELVQVSVFLAAFSGLYFAVYAVTDETYRDQFFTQVRDQLERAVAVRSVYVTLRRPADD